MEYIEKLQLFRKFWGIGFGIMQIIDSCTFPLLLTHIGLNFNEKVFK